MRANRRICTASRHGLTFGPAGHRIVGGTTVPQCEMPEATGTQAIDRAAQLLVRVVEAAQPPSIGELAARAGLPKSTTSRLVSALERQGLVQRLGDRGRLTAGPVLLRYANRDVSSTLVELAAPSLRRLADASGETINLAVPGVDRRARSRARRTRSTRLRTARRSTCRALHLRAFRPADPRPHRAACTASDRRGEHARGTARPPRPHARCRMTPEEILKGLYDNTLIGNAPEVKQLTEQGVADGMDPESMLYDALIPSLEEVGARFERGDFFVPEMLIA